MAPVADLALEEHPQRARIAVLRVLLQRRLEGVDRLGIKLQGGQRVTEIDERHAPIGPERDGGAEAARGLVGIADVEEREPEIVQRLRVLGRKLEGATVARDRLVE